jgi:hypothetical protein
MQGEESGYDLEVINATALNSLKEKEEEEHMDHFVWTEPLILLKYFVSEFMKVDSSVVLHKHRHSSKPTEMAISKVFSHN